MSSSFETKYQSSALNVSGWHWAHISLITAQKHKFTTSFTDLSEAGWYFMETTFLVFPLNVLRQLRLSSKWFTEFSDEQMAFY